MQDDDSWDRHVAEALGRLNTSVRNLTIAVKELTEQSKQASGERAELSHRTAELKKTIDSYEPDMLRCRMWRNWGAGSVLLIGIGYTVLQFWDKFTGFLVSLTRP